MGLTAPAFRAREQTYPFAGRKVRYPPFADRNVVEIWGFKGGLNLGEQLQRIWRNERKSTL